MQADYSAFTTAEVEQLLTDAKTHLTRLLTGAQTATVGDSRSFSMARIPEIRNLIVELSAELRARGETGGDFILGSFNEPGAQPPSDLGLGGY